MARIDQFSRVAHHRISVSGQQFTVPTSNDHSDQTWLTTDLYVGEVGVNIVDDTVWVRTNNGIVQLGTSFSSTGFSMSSPFIFNSPNIIIGTTYSADAVTPNGVYYTDLGTTTTRWKDLYLGGGTSSLANINVNGGVSLFETGSNGILVSNITPTLNTPFVIYGTVSSSLTMDRPLHINSKDTYYQGAGNQRAIIASDGVIMYTASNTGILAGVGVVIADGMVNHAHLGRGFDKTNFNSNEVVAGGSLAVRGIGDDGSTQYDRSDWRTTQDNLRTTNALTTNITTIPWVGTASGNGNAIQVTANIMSWEIADGANAYSCQVTGFYTIDATGTVYEISVPVFSNEMSSWVGTQPQVEMSADIAGVYIKVTGLAATTIQWLNSYSFHQAINIA